MEFFGLAKVCSYNSTGPADYWSEHLPSISITSRNVPFTPLSLSSFMFNFIKAKLKERSGVPYYFCISAHFKGGK